jgi:hypothetical protein
LRKQLRFYFKRFQSEIDASNFAQIFPTRGTIWDLISWNLFPPSLTGIPGKCFAVDRKFHCLVRVFVFGHNMFRWAPAMLSPRYSPIPTGSGRDRAVLRGEPVSSPN